MTLLSNHQPSSASVPSGDYGGISGELTCQELVSFDGLASGMHRLQFAFFHIGIESQPHRSRRITSTRLVKESSFSTREFGHLSTIHMSSCWTNSRPNKYPVLDLLPDCRLQEQASNYDKLTDSITASSQAEYMCLNLGFKDVTLRHPRLYRYKIQRSCRTKSSCTRLDQTAAGTTRHRSARTAERMRDLRN